MYFIIIKTIQKTEKQEQISMRLCLKKNKILSGKNLR